MANLVNSNNYPYFINLVHNKKKEKKLNKNFIIFSFAFLVLLLIPLSFAQPQTKGTFTIQSPNFCGDGVLAGNEECDTLDLAGQTCITRGYDAGTLTCNDECMFDESLCTINQLTTPSGGGGGGGAPIITQCNDKKDNDNDGLCDYGSCIINNTKLEADPGCSNNYDDSESDKACYTSWVCDPWGTCIPETLLQERLCVDEYYCKKEITKTEKQECVLQIIPKPKCIFFFLPCWIWILILCILIASAIYYYYKKKKELISILLPKQKTKALTPKQKSVIEQIEARKSRK